LLPCAPGRPVSRHPHLAPHPAMTDPEPCARYVPDGIGDEGNSRPKRAPGPPRADHRSTCVRVVADRSADRPVVHEIPDKRAHLSPAVNVVLRHVRCPTLQKWPNRPTKIDRSRSIRVGGYGPLLH
jgi:hypothetical protein